MGAGHPRMGFELDTYTAVEPAHFIADQSYVERKGPVDDVQVWAVGQAVAFSPNAWMRFSSRSVRRKDFLPELVLFDCQSCHHPYNSLPSERNCEATSLLPAAR
jgi:hypothetical protein